MRAIIFGGSGFIGSHLCRQLLDDGIDVTVADLVPPTWHPNGPSARYEYCDVRSPITVEHDLPYDVVYNLAAIHRTPGHEPHEYYETNVLGAQNVTAWCDAGGEERLVFTSSISVYGPSEQPKSERSPLAPNSDYGRSKMLAERCHQAWRAAREGRELVIVRPAVVFGAGERGNFTRLAGALARGRFVLPGRTDVIKSCGYVEDLVESLHFMQAQPEDEVVYNFAYPQRYDIGAICDAFADVAGFRRPRTLPRHAVPTVMTTLKLMNPRDVGSLSAARVAKLTMSTNVQPDELVERGFKWRTDLHDALRAWHADGAADTFV